MSNDLAGPDHRFAVEPDELRALVERVRDAEAALGTGVKEIQSVEWELRQFARRAVFSTMKINAGEELTRENTAVLRRGEATDGLEPHRWTEALGRRAARDIAPHTAIVESDYA